LTNPTIYYGTQKPGVFNPSRDVVFKLFAPQTAPFYLICAYAAYDVARLRGQQESIDGLRFKITAIQNINKRIGDPTQRYTEKTFVAVGTFLWFLQAYGNLTEPEFRIQYNGVKQMLRARGGLKSFRDHKALDMTTCWLFLLLSADHVINLQRLLETDFSLDWDTSLELQELSQAAKDMLLLLGNLHLNEFSAFYGHQASQINELRSMLFLRETILYRFLSEDFEIIPIPNRRAIKQSLQLACLLYINLALWEHRRFPDRIILFLSRLHDTVFENDVTSIELLTWNLFRDIDNVPERKWSIVCMQQAAEFLTSGTRELIKILLLLNLAPRRPWGVFSPFPIELYMDRIRGDLARHLTL
jgi:hypothetical protein